MDGINTPLDVIDVALGRVEGLHILDVGCGTGSLARALAGKGAAVFGIDPRLAGDRRADPVRLVQGRAEALPMADGVFDAVTIVNALHHVPPASMPAALAEARRVLVPGGTLVVVEPLAEGSFFDVLRCVEDETLVRRKAQEALSRACADGLFDPVRRISYVREDHFVDCGAFLERIVAADPDRRALIAGRREEIEEAFEALARGRASTGHVLHQPIVADILRPRDGLERVPGAGH